jgi:hypothetical protein
MLKSTTKDTSVTSATNLPLDYQAPQVMQEMKVPSLNESSSGVVYPSLEYTAAKTTASSEGVVLVVNIGTTPREEFVRELNAKIEGSIQRCSTVSSES